MTDDYQDRGWWEGASDLPVLLERGRYQQTQPLTHDLWSLWKHWGLLIFYPQLPPDRFRPAYLCHGSITTSVGAESSRRKFKKRGGKEGGKNPQKLVFALNSTIVQAFT